MSLCMEKVVGTFVTHIKVEKKHSMRRICPCISTLFNGGGETIILLLKSINFNT